MTFVSKRFVWIHVWEYVLEFVVVSQLYADA